MGVRGSERCPCAVYNQLGKLRNKICLEYIDQEEGFVKRKLKEILM